jgi:hypothetical protein
MGLSDRLNKIATSVNSESDNGNSDYETKAGIYICTVKAVEESPQNHSGSPYLLFKMRTEENKMISAKLWVASELDDADKANRKDHKIKQIFENLEVSISGKSAGQLMADAIGKKAQFAFQEREYIAVDKETKKPEIKSLLNYYYSNKIGQVITPLNESNCIQKLSQGDERKFEQQLMTWQKQNGDKNNKTATDEKNTPF